MGLTALGKADEKNTGKMGKILEKLMKKYWKNAKNTGKVYEKILEKCKKNWKSQGNSSVLKSGNHALLHGVECLESSYMCSALNPSTN